MDYGLVALIIIGVLVGGAVILGLLGLAAKAFLDSNPFR